MSFFRRVSLNGLQMDNLTFTLLKTSPGNASKNCRGGTVRHFQ